MSLGDQEIRAIVSSVDIPIRRPTEWLAKCLIERRDKIGRAFYRKVLPVDKFDVDNNQLVFQDLSEKAGFGSAGPYQVQWLEFDPGTGPAGLIPAAIGSAVPDRSDPYILARITGTARPNQFVDVTLRFASGTPKVVAINRGW